MSLHQRVSAGRRPSVSHAVPFGSSRNGPSSSAPLTHTTATAASDYEQRLLDSLNSAHTELNKTNSERDRYKNLFEQASKKLADANLANTDLKSQIQNHKDSSASLKERLQHLKEESERLNFENAAMGREYAELKAKYSALTLTHQYNVLNGASPTLATTGSLPERPKLSRSSSKKERKEDRNRDKEKERDRGKEKEKEKEKDKEKEKKRENEREKEKEKEKEKKEHKAEKERLSRRFEERRAPPPSAPPTSNRRGSFIEGWGPGGRSSSSGSSNRSYTNVAPGHAQGPAAVTPTHKTAYSGAPRTPTNPMTPRTFNGSGATTVYDDDAGYEDGNYHAYPISR